MRVASGRQSGRNDSVRSHLFAKAAKAWSTQSSDRDETADPSLEITCLRFLMLARLFAHDLHAGGDGERRNQRAIHRLFSLPAYVAWDLIFVRREAVVRSHCVSNLKTIMIAMYQYHDDFGCFPPAYIADENGRPQHSWRVIILPYLNKTGEYGTDGLQRVYDSYDFSESWDGPNNRKLAHQIPLVYACGEDSGRHAADTSYLLITGENSAFPGSRSIRRDEIRDGTSKTILAVETRNSGINWMEPKDYPIEHLRFGPDESPDRRIGGNHHGGANAGFADGSVRFLHEATVRNEMLKALATIDRAERIDRDDF